MSDDQSWKRNLCSDVCEVIALAEAAIRSPQACADVMRRLRVNRDNLSGIFNGRFQPTTDNVIKVPSVLSSLFGEYSGGTDIPAGIRSEFCSRYQHLISPTAMKNDFDPTALADGFQLDTETAIEPFTRSITPFAKIYTVENVQSFDQSGDDELDFNGTQSFGDDMEFYIGWSNNFLGCRGYGRVIAVKGTRQVLGSSVQEYTGCKRASEMFYDFPEIKYAAIAEFEKVEN